QAKATTIKEALLKWVKHLKREKASEATAVKLYGQIPPIENMDASLSNLVNCETLKPKIKLQKGVKYKQNINDNEAVGDTLEELWISYNLIEKLKGIHVMKKLKVLYMSNNLVKEWGEFQKLADLPALADIIFVGNPLEEKYSADGNWIEEATKRLPKLKKLDGK
uniref:Dynein axonemal light chain 1 n=1 Tax=Sinocyclocheilus anshuiensis TaxID=1608454 RepID=A0A671Q8K4_9TELE